MAFTAAFALETLLFSGELRTRIPVAAMLSVVMLLISWCIGTTFQAETGFSALSRVHVLKHEFVKFTRSLRGVAIESGLYGRDTGDSHGQGMGRVLG